MPDYTPDQLDAGRHAVMLFQGADGSIIWKRYLENRRAHLVASVFEANPAKLDVPEVVAAVAEYRGIGLALKAMEMVKEKEIESTEKR